jgi:hypothetical protein
LTADKVLRVDNFHGWDYILYDKYGHVSTLSRSYGTEDEATTEMETALIRGESDMHAGPYVGVLFYTPPTITITGKMVTSRRGKIVPLN